MSWSCFITFFATGEFNKVAKLEDELSSLFDSVHEIDHVGGGLVADVNHKYGGEFLIYAASERHPELAFNGTLVYEQELQDGSYSVFTATNGRVEWRQFNGNSPMTPKDIENRIGWIDKKIARLRMYRDMCLRQIQESEVKPLEGCLCRSRPSAGSAASGE